MEQQISGATTGHETMTSEPVSQGADMLVIDREAIVDLCRRRGVRRLSIFGSALTDRFDADHSDVDFLVEFDDTSATLFDDYFGLKEDLETLLGRSVDLVMPSALKNPYFASSVRASEEEIYAA
ncbi:MAG: nucleotidyltransferase domain-containing protein [Brachybacterium sp.]|uniref:nucleotidyltransferase family protein n=1 Tax=Brachybacterium sp. TaxID=1891286 RepID=UPI00264856D8|nr:nucleotidyltransferase domain-containing protein [Brachybacterium sp.]MDN5687060.1 nucleotidyltransferase domain-containing protein [Brachybacterium sp.]